MIVLAPPPSVHASLPRIIKKEKVYENSNTSYKNGGAKWSRIEETSNFGGGAPFKPHHIILDKEFLDIREAKE